jgi:hypothetical protein
METEIATFPFDDTNLDNFMREVERPMDCVINALELLGLLDHDAALLMRLSCVGTQGLQIDQIEKMINYMSYRTESNVMIFMEFPTWGDFTTQLSHAIEPNIACFCGITRNDGSSHVFLIAGQPDYGLVLLDPQMDAHCGLQGEDDDCLSLVRDDIASWYILCRSNLPLNSEIMNQIVDTEQTVTELAADWQ